MRENSSILIAEQMNLSSIMTQIGRSEYGTATSCQQTPPALRLTNFSTTTTTNKDPESAGNRSGPQTWMGAASSVASCSPMVLVKTSIVQGLGQSLDEIPLLRPSMAAPIIRGREKSHCFHLYQPHKSISTQHTTSSLSTSTTTSLPPSIISPCTYKLEAVITRTSISSSVAVSTPLAACRSRGFCRMLIALSLVASVCLIGAQCAPTTAIKATKNLAGTQLTEARHHMAKAHPPPVTKREPMVVIELAAADRPASTDEADQTPQESKASDDDTIILVLTDLSSKDSSSSIRRLIKRSGISDQRLAEIQMIRALKKQLEKASKLAASNLNSAGQESNSS